MAAILEVVAANLERIRAAGRDDDVEWWQAQLDWLGRHRADLAARTACDSRDDL